MKKLMLLLFSIVFASIQLLQAQGTQITGTVTSAEDKTGIPGASIVVKGTTLGTISSFDGTYKLTVPASATTLVFSFVGLKTVEVPIEGRTTIDVVMETDVLNVDEVVVTAIGIKKESKSLGYAVSDVKSEAISKSNNTNVLNSLNGKVPGVQITSSTGAAGASSFIEIRGSSSITGNNQPLFVVDGVPIITGGGGGGVDGVAYSDRAIDINPNDIETMSVLKGGAATALYGLRAANGAIIITTKKGQPGKKMQVNFHSAVTIDKISQVPALQNKFSQGLGGKYSDALSAGANKNRSWGARLDTMSYTTDPSYALLPGGYSMDDYIKYWNPNGYLVPASSAFANGKAAQTYNQYDYFQTGVSYDNSLSVSSGNDLSSYYMSIGNVSNGSIIPGNKFNRTNFKLAADTKLSDKLKVEASVNYTNSKGDRIQQGSNTSGVMLGLLRTPTNFDNAYYGYELPSGDQRDFRGINGGFDNPYWVSNNIKYVDQVDRINGYTGFSYTPLDWLTVNYKAGVDWFLSGYKDYFAIHSNSYPDGRNAVAHSLSRDINSDLMFNIHKTFATDFDFNLILGQNMYQSYYEGTSAIANGLLVQGWENMANTSDNRGYEGSSKYRTAALFGNLDLGYKSLLYLSATLRNEWSTSMPANKNSFMYPSVGLSFVFTELPFLKGNNVLSFGKIRGSWAKVAMDAGIYNTKTYWYTGSWADGWTTGVRLPFAGTNGVSYGDQLGNSKLKPETTLTYEVGADLKFFNNRFNVDIAYFKKDSKDLLLPVPIAASTGYGTSFQNAGEMTTTGVELTANVDIIHNKDFTWNLGVNFSNPYSKVTKLATGVPNLFLGGFTEPQVRAVAGKAYRSIYGWAMQKAPNGQPIISDEPGNFQGYPMPTYYGEQEYIGQVAPKWITNLTTMLKYKGLSLSALLQIKKGGLMWNGTKGALYSYGTHKDTESRQADDLGVYKGLLGHFDANGNLVHFDTDGVTELPGAGSANTTQVVLHAESWTRAGYGNGFNGPSSPYIEKSDWVRLREITLSYSLATPGMQDKFMKGIEVYFTGRNLFLSTPYTGIDPETSLTGASNSQGFDYFNMPGTKAYTFGVKFTF